MGTRKNYSDRKTNIVRKQDGESGWGCFQKEMGIKTFHRDRIQKKNSEKHSEENAT